MVLLKVLVIVIVIGEGGSGGVLGIGIVNKVLMLENSIYFVIFFEGVVVLLWKDSNLVKIVVEIMKIIVYDIK